MSKTRNRPGKSAKSSRSGTTSKSAGSDRHGEGASQPSAQMPSHSPGPPLPPPGQRLFDMPYSSQVPSPVRPDLGITSLVARAGHNAGYDIDVTLLDAADHRLIRTGVLLAHRVLDGRGEWYLGAPDWAPLLPEELIEPMSSAELPDGLGELVRPFRRGAPLSPVAALRCERREFALRNSEGKPIALLRDDKVTVRRNGLTTARYREVMMTPVGRGLDAAQIEWLGQCLESAGATGVDHFPRLVRRLGAPATGPSDLPISADPAGGTFGQLLTQLLGSGARDLIAADLALIGEVPEAEERLIDSVSTLHRRLEGLREVLGDDWVSEALEDLDWLVSPGDPSRPVSIGTGWPDQSARSDDLAAFGGPTAFADDLAADAPRAVGLRSRLRSLRYLSLLDRLVAAARAPRSGADPSVPAVEGVEGLYAGALTRFTGTADRLAVDGTAQTWDAAWTAGQDVTRAAVIRDLVAPDQTARDIRRLTPALDLLKRVHRSDRQAADTLAGIHDLSPAEAFEAGRRFERDRDRARAVRSDFVSSWPKTRRKLG